MIYVRIITIFFERKRTMEKKLPGVCSATKKDGTVYYRSSITHLRKHISLGSYSTPSMACGSYLEAPELLKDTSLTLHYYSSLRILPFEQCCLLFNFCDNGLYFATPIYLYKKYFKNMLSPTKILKFDLADLFYYYTRKIMKR